VVVDTDRERELDLGLELTGDELGAIASHELWADVLDRIAEMCEEKRTTLVFVNTRRLVERVAHQLSERLGEDAVVAHHGSLSKNTRLRAEERLKQADVRVCVATASLELGIDIGSIDLVCQIGSPRSVSVFVQRIGRSGHGLGRTPRGRLFPLTRDELVECVTLLHLARRGELDVLTVPPWPLDVLTQQLVSMCAFDAWTEDDAYECVRRAWPYRELPRASFDQVVEILSRGYDTSRGRRSAFLLRDGVNHVLRGRRGARISATTSGGAIPDNADYDVVQEPDGTHVGRINEDFAVESMAGDVFLLGNMSWRIRRIERGRVRVEDAAGAAPSIPFWLGEAPARTEELSRAVGELRDRIDQLLEHPDEAGDLLAQELRVDRVVADQLLSYVAEGKRVLGVVPTARRIVAERFFDESGGMQLIIHAPLGGRINRAWGLALRKKFCRSFDFELQAAATDEGINLSLGPQHSFPLADVFRFVSSRVAAKTLEQAVLPSPIFATRWRWTASRSLALLRFQSGRKVPPPLQRMRSDDLLAAVFPQQAACQDNAPPGDIALPDHPLVFETMRDCLTEALDVAGLSEVLRAIERDEVEIVARDTPQPSVFSHQILNAMPYAFLDDAPLEERRARAVALRRALPEDDRDLGRLDPEAIAAAADDAWPTARDAHELHDALLSLLVMGVDELDSFGPQAGGWLDELARDGRVVRLGGHLAPAEEVETVRAAFAGDAAALRAVVRARAAASGPFRSATLAERLGVALPRVDEATAALEGEGVLLRGAFTTPGSEEWCDRRILARIHRATIRALRREIEPVETGTYLRFLTRWQHVATSSRLDGLDGVRAAIELLQGYETAAAAWESALLPARVRGFDPGHVERLCLGGEVAWGRMARREPSDTPRRAPLGRLAPITLALRQALPWLLAPAVEPPILGSRAELVRDLLEQRGAIFADEIARQAKLLPTELEEALGELVANGMASADGLAPLRRLARPARTRSRASRWRKRAGRRASETEGRWFLLERPATAPEDAMAEHAAQLLRRYGVLFRDLLARESAPPWRDLLPALRRAEARGEIRGGRFVAGRIGEQFALAEAVDELRRTRRTDPTDELVVVSASDPLNLAGVLTPGPRVTASPDTLVALRDGVVIASCGTDRQIEARSGLAEADLDRVSDALLSPTVSG